MNTYRIRLGDRDVGTLRAKTAENALVNYLRILSATHHLKRGTMTDAKRHNRNPILRASAYLWQTAYQRPVFATADLV